ncbi:MAG: hypothetical protein EOM72_11570 [Opitutae bacterium]|nr:hypothetical protein [Opitutae bacterium]
MHREYTRPIAFYGEQGERAALDEAAPDLMALQSVMDARAQEGLMGKETLLELTFGSGGSVFAKQAPLAGPVSPAAGGGEAGTRRRKPDGSERNWLVKSLTLPHLGQASGNAAMSAMSSGAKESSWGWLADEVASQANAPEALLENLSPEEEFNPAAAEKKARTGGATPSESVRAGSRKEGAAPEPANAASFPARTEVGQKPSDRAAERTAASALDLSGGTRAASASMHSYRSSGSVAEMSQTRQMIAELSAGARTDLASLQASIRDGGPIDSGSGSDRLAARRALSDFSPRAGEGGGAWRGADGRSTIGSGLASGGAPGPTLWQGGWSAQNAGGSGLSRFDSRSAPTPPAMSPAAARGHPRPGASSVGNQSLTGNPW